MWICGIIPPSVWSAAFSRGLSWRGWIIKCLLVTCEGEKTIKGAFVRCELQQWCRACLQQRHKSAKWLLGVVLMFGFFVCNWPWPFCYFQKYTKLTHVHFGYIDINDLQAQVPESERGENISDFLLNKIPVYSCWSNNNVGIFFIRYS